MPPTDQKNGMSTISEAEILESYLLNPSPLPTILPYATFLTSCVPTQYRNHPHIKRLYRDLQFQRNIDVEVVRAAIERECSRAPALKGRLAGAIARERGIEHLPEEAKNSNQGSRKRKRPGRTKTAEDDESEGENGETRQKEDLITDALLHQSHPASSNHIITSNATADKSTTTTTGNIDVNRDHSLHTPTSLKLSMEKSIESLENENDHLDRQTSQLFRKIEEIIGDLSDLRYGRSLGSKNEKDGKVEEEVVRVIEELNNAVLNR